MKQKLMLIVVLGLSVFALSAAPLQADFVQCPVSTCTGTDNDDVINGTETGEMIEGLAGNDFISGGAGEDTITGSEGDDVLFGGPGSDILNGQEDNDTMFPGPDSMNADQEANGGPGNDTTNVFVSDTTYCLLINDMGGADVANFFGFGPYVATSPFGQSGFGTGYVQIVDPVANGEIWVFVSENDDQGVEVLNGLLSPDVFVQPSITGMCELD